MWLIFCIPGFTSAGFIRSKSQPSYCIGKISILLILNSGCSHHHSLLLHTLWIVCRQRAPGWGGFTACHWFQKQALHRILLICFKVAPWKLRFCHNGDLAKGIMTKSCEGPGSEIIIRAPFIQAVGLCRPCGQPVLSNIASENLYIQGVILKLKLLV